jgi:hypothetical protein
MDIIMNEPTDEDLNSLNKVMDLFSDYMEKETLDLMKELDIPKYCAEDVLYLRSRSRWTQEKEDYLIWLGKHNLPLPNFYENFEVPENYKGEK